MGKEWSNLTKNKSEKHSSPAGVVGDGVQSISVVFMPERRVWSKVGGEIDLAQRHVHKRVETAAHVVLVHTETLQMHNKDVGGSPQVHLLGGIAVFFAVRAPARDITHTSSLRARH